METLSEFSFDWLDFPIPNVMRPLFEIPSLNPMINAPLPSCSLSPHLKCGERVFNESAVLARLAVHLAPAEVHPWVLGTPNRILARLTEGRQRDFKDLGKSSEGSVDVW